jgi:hypothetical protein
MSEKKNEYSDVDALGTAKFFIHIGKKKEANEILDAMLPYCHTMEQLDAIGYVYTKNRNFKRGLEIAIKQLPKARNPQEMWDCRVNIIRSSLNFNQPQQAIRYINANKAIDPLDQPNLMDEAYSLFLLNRKDEGEKILRSVISNPQSQDIYNRCLFNLGSYELRNGNFKKGARDFLLAGRTMEIWHSFSLKNEFWSGKIEQGRTLVLMAEGGIGDEIINVRFCKHIKDLGMNPIWHTDRKDLAELFNRNGFETISSKELIQDDWLWTYSMLAPIYLELDESDLWYGQYLKPKEETKSSKKIGIKVSGNPEYDQDLARSIPLEDFIDSIPDEYEIYSFHKDEVITHPRVINWMCEDTTWEDTFNKISEMDMVVSSCTSLIHAAGAMNKKSVVMVPILKYYLWANDKAKSPWYGETLTVLHQDKPNDWSKCLSDLKAML